MDDEAAAALVGVLGRGENGVRPIGAAVLCRARRASMFMTRTIHDALGASGRRAGGGGE